jgi:hypothetical protein
LTAVVIAIVVALKRWLMAPAKADCSFSGEANGRQ